MLKNICPRIPDKFDDVRSYQKEAYVSWKDNKYAGIFSMATGTGKTVTSLYCSMKEYYERKKNDPDASYQILILVPTQTLVKQWEDEVNSFKFKNIIKAYGKNPNWHKSVKKIIDDEKFLKLKKKYVIISTYISFINKFDSHFSKLSEDTLLIADEVHNAGSPKFLKLIERIQYKKRIGLSATPKRIYDSSSSEKVENFFNTKYPYTFSYSMKEAIKNGILCEYYYYPEFVELTEREFKEYSRLTKEIGVTAVSSNDKKQILSEKQKKLLIQRKRLINSAKNKKICLINLLDKIGENNLKYCLVYAPGGKEYFDHEIDIDEERIITQLQALVNSKFPNLSQNRYLGETKDRQDIISGFKNGIIDVLFAINCLDEGVDIPITKIGVFTSSTGNPRQFIQRRGRLLRKHPDKNFAYIYDMVTIPPKTIQTLEIEKRMVLNELKRVKYFLELSTNYYDFQKFFDDICGHYQISYEDIKIDEEMI
jgi:superfamily II DNA or RNA helicase